MDRKKRKFDKEKSLGRSIAFLLMSEKDKSEKILESLW
jgi:hypothetical protein